MRNIIKAITFLLILIIVVDLVGNIFIPKWNDEWLATPIVKDFYKLPENSIDVLAIGSSQVVRGFSALELYKNYGISAYGIGTGQQSIQNSYAWIKESTKTQNEKVICLEIKMLFEDTPEEQNRKGVDNMKFSLNKLENMIVDAKEAKSYESFISYLFPITRFHSRWKEIGTENFTEPLKAVNYRGYTLENEVSGNLDYMHLEDNIPYDAAIDEERYKCINNIIKYCKEKDIGLIFVKMLDMDWDIERHNAIQTIAEENDIKFFDFNMKDLMEDADLLYAGDTSRNNHLNITGAEKTTNYLGKYIKENYEIEDKRENKEYEYLDEQLEQYNNDVQNAKIVNIFDINEYIKALNKENFTVVITKNKLDNTLSEKYVKVINALGIDIDKINKSNYYVIIENGKIIAEQGSDENIHIGTMIDTVRPLVINTENASMIFEGTEVSNFHKGLDIFVYNNKSNNPVESSYIDFENGVPVMGR